MSRNSTLPEVPPPCRWCGLHHTDACSRVRAIEYHPDGTVKRVEFHEPRPMTTREITENVPDCPSITRGWTPPIPQTVTLRQPEIGYVQPPNSCSTFRLPDGLPPYWRELSGKDPWP